jgi:cold shock CspA family protein
MTAPPTSSSTTQRSTWADTAPLEENQKVEYTVTQGAKGPQAEQVHTR